MTGLDSKYCRNLAIFKNNLLHFGNHKLVGLEYLFIELASRLDSIRTFPVSKLHLANNSIIDITEINHLKYLNDLELVYNYDLSNCSIDVICKNLDNPNFRLKVELNSNGCNSKEEIREKCTSFSENELNNVFEIYPQPVINELHLNGLKEPTDYKISNIEGKIIQHGQADDFIDVSNLSKGFYVLHLYLKRNGMKIKTFKMIKI